MWDTLCWGCEAACLPSCSLHKRHVCNYPFFCYLSRFPFTGPSDSECSLRSTDLPRLGNCRIQKIKCSDCSRLQGPFAGSLLRRIRGGCTKGSVAHLEAWSTHITVGQGLAGDWHALWRSSRWHGDAGKFSKKGWGVFLPVKHL